MLCKLVFGTIAAVGLLAMTGASADAGCHRRGGFGPAYGGFSGPGYGYGHGHGYGIGIAARPVPVPVAPYPAYPMYGYYPFNYGYGPGYAPGYGQAFGLQTGNFSLFLGR